MRGANPQQTPDTIAAPPRQHPSQELNEVTNPDIMASGRRRQLKYKKGGGGRLGIMHGLPRVGL